MRNPYNKVQNSSMHVSKSVMNGRIDKWTDDPEAICPANFFKVRVIMMLYIYARGEIYTRTDDCMPYNKPKMKLNSWADVKSGSHSTMKDRSR